jgi:hypothetical protein
MRYSRSGWCDTGHCSHCPGLLQQGDDHHREIRCDCACHVAGERILAAIVVRKDKP